MPTSSASLGFMYAALFVLVVAGVGAGVLGHWFAQRWPWAALALLVAISGAMAGYAGPYNQRLRWALGLPSHNQLPASAKLATPTELDALLRAGRPGRIAAIGGVGLTALLWLMVFKPF